MAASRSLKDPVVITTFVRGWAALTVCTGTVAITKAIIHRDNLICPPWKTDQRVDKSQVTVNSILRKCSDRRLCAIGERKAEPFCVTVRVGDPSSFMGPARRNG